MSLQIQDPTDPEGNYLIDALIDACDGARAGGGAFAFLSSGGVRLFLKDTSFKEFMEYGHFDLIIGVDAITDSAAIEELAMVQENHPMLGARILIPSHPRSIFHPKFAWFDRGDGGVLLTGSGNLTAGGLRWNVEAYSVQELDGQQMAELRAQWDAFLHRTADSQFAPGAPEVLEQLQKNDRRRKILRRAGIELLGNAEEEEAFEAPTIEHDEAEAAEPQAQPTDEVPPVENSTSVLVAEIPNGGTRWEQANFSKAIFIDFFGASMTARRRIYLFHVREDGALGEQEVRPAVAVKSRNYRFELHAAKGLAYPVEERPIGLFAKIATKSFLYMLLMPGSMGYQQMTHLLDTQEATRPDRMRRFVFDASEVKEAWPDAPIWRRFTV
ncbi:phospholipase D family protein [Burkholderia ubonensis]|uniref:phospholipase D family protein n=1 Tax=Burkholderia ubonensis TaxID=101571 RepID=UPI000B0DA4A5|nr:phospholipase D family protein [Burkholderia ubonensis]